MKPKLYYAKNKDIDPLVEKFLEKKYKIYSGDDNYVLLKKNNYGKLLYHAIPLLLALFTNYLFIFINLAYFLYSFFRKSDFILITSDKSDKEGKPLEFDDINDYDFEDREHILF